MNAELQCFYVRPTGEWDAIWEKEVDVRVTPTPLGRPVTGYGRRIPTSYMVKFKNRWRRVYCCQYSNAGTLYIGTLSLEGEKIIVSAII